MPHWPAASASLPYCGTAPAPAELAVRWNLDPLLIGALLAVLVLYATGCARLRPLSRRGQRFVFYAGWTTAALALLSPLCALSVSLFSARVSQHMVLGLIAAPMLAAGRPEAVLAALGWRRGGKRSLLPGPMSLSALFAVLLWFWHAPAPYAATFASTFAYWAMHLSLLGSALALWSALLDPSPRQRPAIIGAALLSFVQMGLLGALITLAPQPLYAPHFFTTLAWGLTPLQDQQFGGAIMWIPGCVMFLGSALLSIAKLIAQPAETATSVIGREVR